MSTLFGIWLFAVGASCSQTQHRVIWVPRKKEGRRRRKETCKQKRRRCKCLKFWKGTKMVERERAERKKNYRWFRGSWVRRKARAKKTARSPHSAVMDSHGSAQMDHRTDRWLDGREWHITLLCKLSERSFDWMKWSGDGSHSHFHGDKSWAILCIRDQSAFTVLMQWGGDGDGDGECGDLKWFFSSASARRTCRWGSHSRSAAS